MVEIWPISIFRILLIICTHNPLKWPEIPYFQKSPSWLYFFSKVYVVGTDKMQKESGQINCTEPRKCQKCAQNWPFLLFFWHFGRLLWSEWTYCHESYKILSVIFWHKFRVPTRGYFGSKWSVQAQKWPKKAQKWPKMLNFKNNRMVLIFPKSMCCGYSKLVPGDVWRDAKWINKG